MGNCKGKRIVITGGSQGYGYGMAKVLKAQGAEVTITGRRKDVLEKAAKELKVDFVRADVCVEKDWDKVFVHIGGMIDVLVNNAGAGVKIAPLTEQSDAEIVQSINVNLTGAILGCRRAAKIMCAQKSGLIINVTSVCSHYGWPGFAVYTAAKAGLDKFSRALYMELRPCNVKVTVVTPSWGDTAFGEAAHMPPADQELNKRKMSPEQMGDLIAYICGFHENMCFPEVMVQPMVQEIIPF